MNEEQIRTARNIQAAAGLVCIVAGVCLWSVPAGVVVCGVLLLGSALVGMVGAAQAKGADKP